MSVPAGCGSTKFTYSCCHSGRDVDRRAGERSCRRNAIVVRRGVDGDHARAGERRRQMRTDAHGPAATPEDRIARSDRAGVAGAEELRQRQRGKRGGAERGRGDAHEGCVAQGKCHRHRVDLVFVWRTAYQPPGAHQGFRPALRIREADPSLARGYDRRAPRRRVDRTGRPPAPACRQIPTETFSCFRIRPSGRTK